jgi:DnaJ-class molecular chaperone
LILNLPPLENFSGMRIIRCSYEIDGASEQLMIRIPEKFSSGGKLRIKGKGHSKNEKRGDLILQVKISS